MSGALPPRDLAAFLARHVPITRALGLRVGAAGSEGVTLLAPLAPNVNDKGIAFGGSIASLLALAGWALTDAVLREAGVDADVVIASTRITFLRPVPGEIVARCPRPSGPAVAAFLAAWRGRGQASWELECRADGAGGDAARARSVYVARPRPPAPG